jgi:predicted alpha/beta hydrolase family esterase
VNAGKADRERRPLVFVQGGGDMHQPEGSIHLANYLEGELGGAYRVIAPEMPDADNPQYLPWRDEIDRLLGAIEGPVVLVGHSIGGSVLVKYLAEGDYRADGAFDNPVAGLFLVSAPYWAAGQDWDWDVFNLPVDFASRLPETRIFLYQSQGDPEVPFTHLGRYREALPEATARVIPGAQHSFTDGLPELVGDIKSLASAVTDEG